MSIKMRFESVIRGLAFALVSVGCIFIFESKAGAVEFQLTTDTAAAAPVQIMPATTYLTTETSHSLAVALPEKLIISDESSALTLTGYRVSVYNSGTEIYNSQDKYIDAGSGIVDLEELVRALAPGFTKESENLVFKVIYIGKNSLGQYTEAKDAEGNIIEWSSDILTVYRISTAGENIISAFTYGFSGQSVVLIPQIKNDFGFVKWSDENTQNPRFTVISTNTAENEYTAVAEAINVEVSENADGGYDVIPKTGEGNSPFWLIFLAVFGVLFSGYILVGWLFVPMLNNGSQYL